MMLTLLSLRPEPLLLSGDAVPLLPAAEAGRGGGSPALQLRAGHRPRQLQPTGAK